MSERPKNIFSEEQKNRIAAEADKRKEQREIAILAILKEEANKSDDDRRNEASHKKVERNSWRRQTAIAKLQLREYRCLNRLTLLAVTFAFISAIGVIASVWYSTGQMKLDQRAWVKFGIAEQFEITPGSPLTVQIARVNIGKTVARRLRSSVCVEKRSVNQSPSFKTSGCRANGNTSGLLYPNEPAPLTAQWLGGDGKPVIVSQADLQDWKDGKIYFAIFGRIEYTDIFGGSDWTTFCIDKAKADTPTRECIEQYNDVDGNDGWVRPSAAQPSSG